MHYNTTISPNYNLSKVTAATYIYQSKYDIIATPKVTNYIQTYNYNVY